MLRNDSLSRFQSGLITSTELVDELYERAIANPEEMPAILDAISSHNDSTVRSCHARLLQRFAWDEYVVDYEAAASALDRRLGSRVILSGGYDHPPMWLAGKEEAPSTVVGSLCVTDERPPLAVARLDEPLDLVCYGKAMHGDGVCLELRYLGDSWRSDKGVVAVYLFDHIPAAVEWWDRRHDFEIESHATYLFVNAEARGQ